MDGIRDRVGYGLDPSTPAVADIWSFLFASGRRGIYVPPRELGGDEEVQPRESILLFSVISRVRVLEIGVRHGGGKSYPHLIFGTLFD
jgi:hypothetical protein